MHECAYISCWGNFSSEEVNFFPLQQQHYINIIFNNINIGVAEIVPSLFTEERVKPPKEMGERVREKERRRQRCQG